MFDLDYSLRQAQPANRITSLLGLYVSGSVVLDNVQSHLTIPTSLDSDSDSITDTKEMKVYGTNPYRPDSDGDGENDGSELLYWGTDWDDDPDSDGVVNLLDPDSDNDGTLDGNEMNAGTDPENSASHP
jgi:hypothetical protein